MNSFHRHSALLIDRLPGETRAAWMNDDRLVRLDIERADRPSHLGAVHRGRVIALAKGIKAAFVDIGLDRPAFLELGRSTVTEGEALTVRVTRDAHADKGARVVRAPEAGGADAAPPTLISPAPDLLDRVLAEARQGDLAVTIDGAPAFAEVRARAADRALQRHDGAKALFEAVGVEEQIDAALSPRLKLAGGGAVSIESTSALIAVDIDGGGLPAAEINREALEEIARQIVLRRLAGQIVIDIIASGKAGAGNALAQLRAALADDPDSQVLGISGLGLIEMTRKRAGPSLSELLCDPCPSCGGRAVKSPATVGYAALRAAQAAGRSRPGRLGLKLAPPVAVALLGPLAPARAAVETRLGGALVLDPVPDRPIDRFELIEE